MSFGIDSNICKYVFKVSFCIPTTQKVYYIIKHLYNIDTNLMINNKQKM